MAFGQDTGHKARYIHKVFDELPTEDARVNCDKLSRHSTREERPGLAALLDYARPWDAIFVVGIDRLGRNAAELMMIDPRTW